MEAPVQTLVKKEILFQPFPKQEEFLADCLSGDYDFVLYGGAIRGGKSFAMLALFIFLCRVFPGSRWAIVRKDLPVIKKNLYPVWHKIKPTNFIRTEPSDYNTHTCTFKNGSQIIFFPESYSTDKEMDNWRGFEVNGFGFEEINECQEQSFNKAFERAGTYIIPKLKIQPKPLIAATCNPTQGWVKERVFTPFENGTLPERWKYIQARIYENLPLMAAQPDLLPNFKRNMGKYEYMVFVDGNWNVQLKMGNEFLRKFEISTHVKPLFYDPVLPVHISIDSNVYPHIAITCWQLVKDGTRWHLNQLDELSAEDPENTASQAGAKIVRWLQAIDYNQPVFLYGDKSTKNRNNIDDDKRSFFQIVQETIHSSGFRTRDKMLAFAPPVSSVGDFVNAILGGEVENMEIAINEICTQSINDYIETKTDKDGGILKVRVKHPKVENLTYEKNGHLTDTMKDFIVQAFYNEFYAWVNKKNMLVPGGIKTIPRVPKITY